jgi:hypothetical protein
MPGSLKAANGTRNAAASQLARASLIRPHCMIMRQQHALLTAATACCVVSGSSGASVMTRQGTVRWFSRPQGDPSGVCTGHMNPQDSGSSFRTAGVQKQRQVSSRQSWQSRKAGHSQKAVNLNSCAPVVVRSSAKYAPRCTDRKWLMYLRRVASLYIFRPANPQAVLRLA